MILPAIGARPQSRSKDDCKGRHVETGPIAQAVS